jgi:hypothetical protein
MTRPFLATPSISISRQPSKNSAAARSIRQNVPCCPYHSGPVCRHVMARVACTTCRASALSRHACATRAITPQCAGAESRRCHWRYSVLRVPVTTTGCSFETSAACTSKPPPPPPGAAFERASLARQCAYSAARNRRAYFGVCDATTTASERMCERCARASERHGDYAHKSHNADQGGPRTSPRKFSSDSLEYATFIAAPESTYDGRISTALP